MAQKEKKMRVGPGSWHFQDLERLKAIYDRGRIALSKKGQCRLKDWVVEYERQD